MSFIHLQTYSAFTLLTSTASVSDLVKVAKEKGFPCIALTDKNVMYGVIEFYKICQKAGIKPIIGLTVDVKDDDQELDSFPLVLIAENNKGYQNLLKISSSVQTKSKTGIPLKWLKYYSEGLIALTPGLEGKIEQLILSGQENEARSLVKRLDVLFGKGNFFLTIQNHHLDKELVIQKIFISFSKELDIPLVATNQVYYIEKTDMFSHECLLAIKNGEKLQDEHREKLGSNEYYLKTTTEMIEIFSDIPEALENTLKIANRCNVQLEMNNTYLPKYKVDNGMSADEFLEEQCKKGLMSRFSSPTIEYMNRLEYELSIIKRMKFSDYFLIVWDFMKYARQQRILTGPGRGSAAGSLVAYVLNITDVDPIEHNLLFERFLNPERVSMPDIDIDFPDHARDEMIEYVGRKYGELHVAQIITFGTLAAKGALRDVGRVFGLNSKELDQLSKLVPSQLGIDLRTAYKQSEKLKAFVNETAMNQRLFETALKLEGLPRHSSTHAAGVIISEKPLVDLIPIQEGHNNVYLTQYSMEYLEEIGLLKMDFLGLRNLSLIESILNTIYQETRKRIDLKSFPLNDQETFKLLSKGETTGIFQLESEGMRKVLVRLIPTNFEDIVAVNALYRPGPMENIPLYIDRKHSRAPIVYPHPDLKPILENTYGVIIYQEQIMQIASKMAGFSLGEADLLRRAVSKKKKEVLDMERKHFVEGALQKGYESPLANDIYDLIVRFANYGFNRSHAVAYSMIAYHLAYLKANFPVCFMAGLLSSVIGNDSKIAQYVREAKQLGISILPPSINESDYSFKVSQGAIRFSLASIKGVGATVLKGIFQARKAKKFEDLFDFCIRVSSKTINRKILESLVHSGCFDEFEEDRATLLASLDVAIEHANLVKPDDSSQIDLFKDELLLKPKYVLVDPIRLEDKLLFEREALGLYLSNHPVAVYEEKGKSMGIHSLYHLITNKNKGIACVYINSLKKIRTKKGDLMAFLTISDTSEELEAIVFPDVLKKYSSLINQGKLIVIDGKIEEREGNPQFLIQKVFDPELWIKEKQANRSVLYLRIIKERQDSIFLQQLKKVLHDNGGETQVVLHYEESGKTIRLENEFNVQSSDKLLTILKEMLGFSNVVLRDKSFTTT